MSGWIRDTYGESLGVSTQPAGCAARAYDYNLYCGLDDVVSVFVHAPPSPPSPAAPRLSLLCTSCVDLASLGTTAKRAATLHLSPDHPPPSQAVAELLIEVALRVPSVRTFAAERTCDLLLTTAADNFEAPPPPAALRASAWILGEHSALLSPESQPAVARAFLKRGVVSLPIDVQTSFLQVFHRTPESSDAARYP